MYKIFMILPKTTIAISILSKGRKIPVPVSNNDPTTIMPTTINKA